MTEEEFIRFWEWLLEKAEDNDAWWLETWLIERLEEYMMMLEITS